MDVTNNMEHPMDVMFEARSPFPNWQSTRKARRSRHSISNNRLFVNFHRDVVDAYLPYPAVDVTAQRGDTSFMVLMVRALRESLWAPAGQLAEVVDVLVERSDGMSERHSVTSALPDGIADREQGYTHNPNPEDEVAAQRARFDEMQRKLQQDRYEAAQAIEPVQDRLGHEFDQAIHNPEHEKFVQEQVDHEFVDRPHIRGGEEVEGDPEAMAPMPTNIEIAHHAPKPTTPRSAEEFMREG